MMKGLANKIQRKHMQIKSKFCPIKTLIYKDGVFEAGFLKNSPHKCNTLYLRQKDLFTHLRWDEAYAIITALSETLWANEIYKLNKTKKKRCDCAYRWLSLKELLKRDDKGEVHDKKINR